MDKKANCWKVKSLEFVESCIMAMPNLHMWMGIQNLWSFCFNNRCYFFELMKNNFCLYRVPPVPPFLAKNTLIRLKNWYTLPSILDAIEYGISSQIGCCCSHFSSSLESSFCHFSSSLESSFCHFSSSHESCFCYLTLSVESSRYVVYKYN